MVCHRFICDFFSAFTFILLTVLSSLTHVCSMAGNTTLNLPKVCAKSFDKKFFSYAGSNCGTLLFLVRTTQSVPRFRSVLKTFLFLKYILHQVFSCSCFSSLFSMFKMHLFSVYVCVWSLVHAYVVLVIGGAIILLPFPVNYIPYSWSGNVKHKEPGLCWSFCSIMILILLLKALFFCMFSL